MEAASTLGSDATAQKRAQVPPVQAARAVPVKWWALAGSLWFAFMTYVMVKWVTGPYFKEVPSGPSEPPTWMKLELIAWQVVTIPIVLVIYYRLLIRPWRREREITTDGLL